MIVSAGKSEQNAGLHLERGPGFPHWTAGFFLSGLTEIACIHRTYLLPAQSCLILPPNTPYQLTIKKKRREIWMLFEPRPALLEALLNPEEPSGVTFLSFKESEIWDSLHLGLVELLKWWGQRPPQLPLAENALEKVIFLAQWARRAQNQTPLDERITRAASYMEEHFADGLNIDVIARVAALSPSRFSHLFRERMGLTPMQYLEFRRVERAKQLLLTSDLQVQEVAARSGFVNSEHFSVRFRKSTGQSPSDFRQKPKCRYMELNPEQL